MNHLITVPAIGSTPSIAINPEAEDQKDHLLVEACKYLMVGTDEVRDVVIRVAGNIKAHLAQVEKDRVALKEPFLTAGRMIDTAAKAHVADLESNLKRLNSLAGAYEAEKQRLARMEEQRRAAEEARLVQEKIKAQREEARLAEEQRKKEETAAAKGKELTDAQKARALEAQMDAAEAAEKLEAEQRHLAGQRALSAQFIAESKPTGGSLRQEIDIEVFDIHALYRDCPQAVRMQEDVAFLKGMAKRGIKYAGVTYTERADFRTRAAK